MSRVPASVLLLGRLTRRRADCEIISAAQISRDKPAEAETAGREDKADGWRSPLGEGFLREDELGKAFMTVEQVDCETEEISFIHLTNKNNLMNTHTQKRISHPEEDQEVDPSGATCLR